MEWMNQKQKCCLWIAIVGCVAGDCRNQKTSEKPSGIVVSDISLLKTIGQEDPEKDAKVVAQSHMSAKKVDQPQSEAKSTEPPLPHDLEKETVQEKVQEPVYPVLGLPNLGSTCYANAALQVVHALYRTKIEQTHGESALAQLLRAMDAKKPSLTSVEMRPLYEALLDENGLKGEYPIGVQKDALCFLDSLHANYKFIELCYSVSSPPPANIDDALSQSWPVSTPQTLNEYFTGSCSPSQKKIGIPLPEILIIEQKADWDKESFMSYTFPVDVTLDVSFLHHPIGHHASGPLKLQLKACMMNTGGHWISYIYYQGSWYQANDASVTKVDDITTLSVQGKKAVYFYQKQG